ncbi:MAG: sirohydrochlorin cobaltochelatase, partial [Thermodesulfobacteriota bacterium]
MLKRTSAVCAVMVWLLCWGFLTPSAAQHAAGHHQPPDKGTGILLVAFGTSVPAAQAALEAVDTVVRRAWPDWRVLWAFSSTVVTGKLRRRGQNTLFARATPLRTLPETYAALREEGVTEAVVQSLHISPGAEYQK